VIHVSHYHTIPPIISVFFLGDFFFNFLNLNIVILRHTKDFCEKMTPILQISKKNKITRFLQ